jgi:hypothetical protein
VRNVVFRVSVSGSLLVLLLLPISGGTPGTLEVGYDAKAIWNHEGKDVNGNPETIAKAEIALSITSMDLRKNQPYLEKIVVPSKAGRNEASISELLADREPGTYRLWIRVIDKANHKSDWGQPATIRLGLTNRPPQRKNVGCAAACNS